MPHDGCGAGVLEGRDDGHDRRNETETRSLNDGQPRAELWMRLNQRRDAHGEIDAGDEKADLRGIHAHRGAEDQRNERGCAEKRQNVLKSCKDHDRERGAIINAVCELAISHSGYTSRLDELEGF
ncbi:hypothetical protein SDC9_171738 [bioreactor metagenome]|uniref:Uncharacterized protein n=1 Tax=bioreactor metagenome TaxID=1076179 RepID=A0A645GE25_9ZZZZ